MFVCEGILNHNTWAAWQRSALSFILTELVLPPAMNPTTRPWKPAHPWFSRHHRDDSRWSQHLTPSRWGAGTAAYFTKWMYLFSSPPPSVCIMWRGKVKMRSFVVSGLISEFKKRTFAAKRLVFTERKYSSRLWWMFIIRCYLFEILSLWLDQKIQI